MAHSLLLLLTVVTLLFSGCHGDCTLPDSGICREDLCQRSEQFVHTFCPHMCGGCGNRTTTDAPATASQVATSVSVAVTTQSSASSGCFDRLTDDECNVIPNFCDDSYARLLCPKSCGFCCEDRVHGTTCEELVKEFPTLCTDHLGMEACAKYCGRCSSTSEPAA